MSKAFKVLRARLLDRKLQAEVTERRETRRKLVKSAERREKIRTYNFAQVYHDPICSCAALLTRILRS